MRYYRDWLLALMSSHHKSLALTSCFLGLSKSQFWAKLGLDPLRLDRRRWDSSSIANHHGLSRIKLM